MCELRGVGLSAVGVAVASRPQYLSLPLLKPEAHVACKISDAVLASLIKP